MERERLLQSSHDRTREDARSSVPLTEVATAKSDEPELTLRAVLAGLLVGTALAAANLYFGLQTGWVSMQSMQSALLGYGLFKLLPSVRIWGYELTVKENVVLQTTAVAVGTMPLAAGFVGIIPALALLDEKKDGPGSRPVILTPGQLLAWSAAVAFFGVFLAIPLRRQVIIKDRLPFPSGTATARVISVLHEKPTSESTALRARSSREDSGARRRGGYQPLSQDETSYDHRERAQHDHDEGDGLPAEPKDDFNDKGHAWKYLFGSFGFSAVYTIAALLAPVLYTLPIFDIFHIGLAADWMWWLTPSPSYIGQGIIMGGPTTVAMNLGMLTAWAILSPLAKSKGWAPGPVGNSDIGVKGWVLWPALAVMMAESVVSLGRIVLEILLQLRGRRQEQREEESAGAPLDEDDDKHPSPYEKATDRFSRRVSAIGFSVSTIACVVIVSAIFPPAQHEGDLAGIHWWATVAGVILAAAFAYLGVKSLGETDLNPVSAIGKISQLAFAVIQPHNVLANVVAGGISEAGAQQAGDLMQDLKTGHLLHASPIAQFYGQMIGSAFSIFISSGLYIIYSRTYELPGKEFAVPTAAIWLNLARLLNRGDLPPRTGPAMIIFGVLGVVAALLKIWASASSSRQIRRIGPWIPSTVAFAIGFINPPSFSIARLIGGLISLWFSRKQAKSASSPGALSSLGLVTVASGLVLGEGLTSIVGVGLRSADVGPLTCFGCGVGGGGYCGGGC